MHGTGNGVAPTPSDAFQLQVREAGTASDTSVYRFCQDCVSIGRIPGNDVELVNEQKAVSRRHAEIRWDGGRYHLVDLGSKNHTLLNGRQLVPEQPYPLRDGDRFLVGGFDVVFHVSDVAGAERGAGSVDREAGALLTRFYGTPAAEGAPVAKEQQALHRAVEELIILSELAFEIGASFDVQEITQRIIHRAMEAVGAEQAVLTFTDEDQGGGRTFVRVREGEQPSLQLSEHVQEWMRKHRKPFRFDTAELGMAGGEGIPHEVVGTLRSLLSVPLVVRARLTGILSVYNKVGAPAFTEADERLLTIIAAQSAQVIENARLHDEEKQLIRVQEELEFARKIQTRLLPTRAPSLPGYDLAGRSLPAASVGGDYFDFIAVKAHQVALCVGDVSGKGLPAALMMANVQATLRGQALWHESAKGCLEQSNQLIYESASRGMFVTLCYGVLDVEHHRFKYANAGHNRPLLLRADGTMRELRTAGLVLGAIETVTYQEETIDLHPGDTLLLYSDGVTEARNEVREEYGIERLIEVFRQGSAASAADQIDHVIHSVETYAGDMPQADDLTLLVLRRLA